MLFIHLEKNIQWEYIQGLFEIAIYGGRIDDPFDLRVLSSYLREYFDNRIVSSTGRKTLGNSVTVPLSIDFKVFKISIFF